MLVYGSSMESLVDYAGALFERASGYLSDFGAADALAESSGPAIIVVVMTLASKRRIQGNLPM
jgi:hypothetical protein